MSRKPDIRAINCRSAASGAEVRATSGIEQKQPVRLVRFLVKLSCPLGYYHTWEFARGPNVNRIQDIYRIIQRSPLYRYRLGRAK